jgi:hypothetical protein
LTVWGFLFVLDLQLGRQMAVFDGIGIPVGKVMLFGQFRTDITLHA